MAEGMGVSTLAYPILANGKGDAEKILDTSVSGNTAAIKYDSGASVTVQLSGSDVSFTFQDVPTDVKEARYEMYIPISYVQGGKWKMGSGAETPFPADKPPKPHLYQDHSPSFSLINFDNNAFTIRVRDNFDYLELTDLREWNNSAFSFLCHVPYIQEHPTYVFTITTGTTAGTSAPAPNLAPGEASPKPNTLVDEFGQIKLSDWPDKIKSEDELTADVKSEQDYYASLTPPPLINMAACPTAERASGCKPPASSMSNRGRQMDARRSRRQPILPPRPLFLPAGRRLHESGRAKQIYDWLPPYEGDYKSAFHDGSDVFSFHSANMIRKYGKPVTFADFQSTMIDRVRKGASIPSGLSRVWPTR